MAIGGFFYAMLDVDGDTQDQRGGIPYAAAIKRRKRAGL
jgi:hypothetical protein